MHVKNPHTKLTGKGAEVAISLSLNEVASFRCPKFRAISLALKHTTFKTWYCMFGVLQTCFYLSSLAE